MKLKHFLIYFILLSTNSKIYSQIGLTGKIVDQNNNPLELLEVQLQNTDSITIASELTDSQGKFKISSAKGNFKLVVRQFGAILHHQILILEKDTQLEDIKVDTKDHKLQEIVITKEKKLIERKIDRLVFNVENSIAASGGDALDALRATPGVRVLNDQVSIIGKSSFSLMVDDRLIKLSGDEVINYLKTIQSNNIKSIEVITTPPAKYDAEGNSGLINIRLKKPKNDSWNASVRSTLKQAKYFTGSTGAGFSLQKNRISLLADFGYTKSKTIYENDVTFDYPNTFWTKYLYNVNEAQVYAPMLSFNYKASEKTTLGAQYIGGYTNPELTDTSYANVEDKSANTLIQRYLTDGNSKINYKRNSVNVNATSTLNPKGAKISGDLDYLNVSNKKKNPFNSTILDSNNAIIQSDFINNIGSIEVNNLSAKIDVTLPLTCMDVEFGSKISAIKTDSEIDINFYNTMTSENYLSQNVKFIYKENTQAVYFSANKKIKKWEFKSGLRLENTQTNGNSVTLNQVNKTNYYKLFPTLYTTYTPSDNNSFSFSLSRRINRPSYEYLNPSRRYSAINSYVYGNPFLQPSFSYNLELQHTYKDLLTTTVSYTAENRRVSQITIPDINDNTQVATWENYADVEKITVDESLSYKFNNWWTTNSSIYFYYNEFDSHIPIIQQKGSGWGSGFETKNTFVLNKQKTLLMDCSYWYDTPSRSLERKLSSVSSLDLSFKYLLLNKNLQLSLVCSNIFKTDMLKVNYYSNGVDQNFRQYYDTRAIRFALSYKFGNNKINVRQRKLGNQEEIQRSNN